MIIEGIKEKNGENLRAIVDELLEDLCMSFTLEWIDSIYRMGPKLQGIVTTVPLSVCYGALNLLVRLDASNFIPYACDRGSTRVQKYRTVVHRNFPLDFLEDPIVSCGE